MRIAGNQHAIVCAVHFMTARFQKQFSAVLTHLSIFIQISHLLALFTEFILLLQPVLLTSVFLVEIATL